MRVGNRLVDITAIADKSCLKCRVIKPARAFKLHTNRRFRKNGDAITYQYLDNTCRQCRWNAIKDRVNASRRKGGSAGERNANAVLTEDWVTFIRSPTGRRIHNVKLAFWSHVSPSTIHLCKSFKTWNKEPR